ncbi:MAG TPA: TetR/AcrR family transcriptional regulator [Stellaceae bacterium]|nr:TetR/AcrR family transcriptional regulator [Stellaceae bacterium]
MSEPSVARDEKEAKILASAKDSFLELGFAATSMDLVAQRARASKTTLYTRFPSKEALFEAVIASECEAYGLRFTPDDFAGLPVDEALRSIAGRFLDLICSPQCLKVEQMILGEAARFPEIARSFENEGPERVCTAVAAYFADAAGRGLLDIADPRFAAEHFLSSLKGPCHHDAILRRPLKQGPEREAFIAETVKLFLNGALRRG